MAEFRAEAEPVAELPDEAGDAAAQSPSDPESRGLQSGRADTLTDEAGERDDSELLTEEQPDADTERAADGAVTSIGRLGLRDVPRQGVPAEETVRGDGQAFTATEPEERGARDRYLDDAQRRYDEGQIPLKVSAATRAAAAAEDRAGRLHDHQVKVSTAAAWNLLRGTVGDVQEATDRGLTGTVAEQAGVSYDAASEGLAQATDLRVREIQRGGSRSQDAERQATEGQRASEGQDPEAGESASSVDARLALTQRLNEVRHELDQTERILAPGERERLQLEHDAGLSRLRGMFRDEARADRDQTRDGLFEYFAREGANPYVAARTLDRLSQGAGIHYEKLVEVYGDGDYRTREVREDFERTQLAAEIMYRYAEGIASEMFAGFPDHAPTESESLAIAAEEAEHQYAKQIVARGADSRQAERALDAAYAANVEYKIARQREFAAVDTD